MAAPEKEEEKKAEKPEPKPAASSGGSKLVVPLLGLNTLLLVGVVALQLLRPQLGTHAVAKADPPAPENAPAEAAHAEGEAAGKKEPEKASEKAGEASTEKEGAGKGKSTPATALPGPTLRLPDFVVHLRDNESERYARMAFEIELGSELDKDKIQAHMPRIRDSYLTFLSDRTVSDLRGAESIARIKQTLLDKMKELVPQASIRALYITDLVIQ